MAPPRDALAALEAELGRKPYRWEINALKTAHRKVPMPKIEPGHCRWCEQPILGKRGKYIGRPDPNRSWCREKSEGRDCWYDYCLHSDAAVQFGYLERTRGLRCAGCGVVDPRRWRSAGQCSFSGRPSPFWQSDQPQPLGWEIPATPWEGERKGEAYIEAMLAHHEAMRAEWPIGYGTATLIEWVSALEVDHVVPLWKVALKPLELRRPFFGPEFLQLLCFVCHKAKTKEEAAERAAIRRAAAAEGL